MKFPYFMEPDSSLPCSQKLTTCHREPYGSNLSLTSYFFGTNFGSLLSPIDSRCPNWSLSYRFPPQNPVWISLVRHACHVPRPSLSPCCDLILTVRSTDHEARLFAIFPQPSVIFYPLGSNIKYLDTQRGRQTALQLAHSKIF